MEWMIEYTDSVGAGDIDPRDYATYEGALDEARERLASGDMPWAERAKIFAVDDEGEPLQETHGATLLTI